MKRLVLILVCAALLVALPGLAQENAPAQAMRLTVYTSHKEEVYRPVIEEFERQTGIWVRVVEGGTAGLLERIRQEREEPVADVMFGGGVESLMAYADCFAPCDAGGAPLRLDCTFEDGRFVAFSRLPIVIIYNRHLVKTPPQGFAQLLDFPGRIAFADPCVSGSSFTALATMIQALPDEDVPARLLEKAQVLPDSGDVITAVAGGICPVGVTLEESARKRILDGEPIGIVWPQEGTSAVPDGAAIIAGCSHPEGAQAFLHFILGEAVQRRVQTAFARLSVRSDLAPEGEEAQEGPLCAYDIPWASAQREAILARWRMLTGEDAP